MWALSRVGSGNDDPQSPPVASTLAEEWRDLPAQRAGFAHRLGDPGQVVEHALPRALLREAADAREGRELRAALAARGAALRARRRQLLLGEGVGAEVIKDLWATAMASAGRRWTLLPEGTANEVEEGSAWLRWARRLRKAVVLAVPAAALAVAIQLEQAELASTSAAVCAFILLDMASPGSSAKLANATERSSKALGPFRQAPPSVLTPTPPLVALLRKRLQRPAAGPSTALVGAHERRETQPTVGWIGTGRMGAAMASRLARAGVDCTCGTAPGPRPSRSPSSARPSSTRSPTWPAATSSSRWSARTQDLEQVLTGDGGLLTDPDDARDRRRHLDGLQRDVGRMREACAAVGTEFLASPVSGNGKVVGAGKLTLVCSGKEGVFDRVHPLLDHIGKRVDLRRRGRASPGWSRSATT